jgi:hypothetical protein
MEKRQLDDAAPFLAQHSSRSTIGLRGKRMRATVEGYDQNGYPV